MPNKKFAMIGTSLPYSKKYRACSNLAKLVYVHLHISSSTNYLGIFHYHDVIIADEVDITVDELHGALTELEDTFLIERDENNEVIRVVGWFSKENGATNASHAIKLIRDFARIDMVANEILFNAIAEFVVATAKRGLNWTKDFENLRAELGPFLNNCIYDYGKKFARAMLDEIECVSKSIKKEIASLMPTLSAYEEDTLSTPCRTGGLDKRLDDTETISESKLKKEKDLDGDFDDNFDESEIRVLNANTARLRSPSEELAKQPMGASAEAKNSALAQRFE